MTTAAEQRDEDGRSAPGDGGPGGEGALDRGASDARGRRLAAWRGCERSLAPTGQLGETIGARLARLMAAAPESYDLDAWTDAYGDDDGVIGALERRTAELLGTEAAVFFPTGTMAQQVALRCWAGRTGGPTVAGHPLSHLEVHERDAYALVSGLRMIHPTHEPRHPTADEIRELGEPFGTLLVELPLREAGFLLPSWDELTDLVEAARERDAVVHFDGARLWESATHFGRPLAEIADLADSVYVSFYKSLDGISGAALAGSESLAEEARAWRHRYGGLLYQQWPAALAALIGLDRELPRLPEYVARAAVVAEALREGFTAAGVPWFRVHPEPPHTHQFQVWLPYPAARLTEASIRQAETTRTALFRSWTAGPSGPPGIAMSEVTIGAPGLEWTTEDIRSALADFLELLAEGERG